MDKLATIAAALLWTSGTALAASADYYLKIEGIARPAAGGPVYLKVTSTGDLDGDGLPDTAVIRVDCAAGTLHSAQYQVTGPRDAASGQASGRRAHKPFTMVTEWTAAPPQLKGTKTGYNVKNVEGTGARAISHDDDWSPISLSNAEAVCTEALSTIVKSKSNITNN